MTRLLSDLPRPGGPDDFPRANLIPLRRLRAIGERVERAARRGSHAAVEYCLPIRRGVSRVLLKTTRSAAANSTPPNAEAHARRVVRVHTGSLQRPDSKQMKEDIEMRKLTKARPKLPTALLALALSLFTAASARAQYSNDARQTRDTDARQTRDAATAPTGATQKSTDADGAEKQKSQRGAQGAGTGPQSNSS